MVQQYCRQPYLSVFVRTSAGTGNLAINTTSGVIDPSNSAPGDYTVSYTFNGYVDPDNDLLLCNNVVSTNVTVLAPPSITSAPASTISPLRRRYGLTQRGGNRIRYFELSMVQKYSSGPVAISDDAVLFGYDNRNVIP
jgi:hypothetical protein